MAWQPYLTITLSKQAQDGTFPTKETARYYQRKEKEKEKEHSQTNEKNENSQLHAVKFKVHNVNASHEWGIPQ